MMHRVNDPLGPIPGNVLTILLPAPSIEALLADPFGRYFLGDSFIYFYPEKSLNGFALWGRPGEADVRELVRALDAELHREATPHVSYVDLRRLEYVDGDAFQVLAMYLHSRFDAFAGLVQKQAILRPGGVAGATVAGFYEVVTPTFPAQAFANTDEALTWLGHPVTFATTLDTLILQAQGVDPTLRRLREAVSLRLGALDLATAAKLLETSERTLQRRLSEAGTSFQAEMNRAQIDAAMKLLVTTDAPLSDIATQVGCASLQHFSAMFRKLEGASPSAWRAKRRGD